MWPRVLVLVISGIALALLYLANRLGRSQYGRALERTGGMS